MSKDQPVIQRLKKMGVRLTPQRLLILDIVSRGDQHLGVEEIFRGAQGLYPYIDIATVYRTLHLFKKLDVVTEVAIGDKLHFELTDPGSRHHHMVCKGCGGAFNLDPDYLDEFRDTLLREFSFEPDLDNFTITGTCALCGVE
jgi:Fe2+ or Zn2+ uptake regulation protein